MPTNKHKRKMSPHTKTKVVKNTLSSGLMTSHPKRFVVIGMLLVMLGVYLLAFKSQSDAMFGLAMLSLVSGAVTTIYANLAHAKKKMQ